MANGKSMNLEMCLMLAKRMSYSFLSADTSIKHLKTKIPIPSISCRESTKSEQTHTHTISQLDFIIGYWMVAWFVNNRTKWGHFYGGIYKRLAKAQYRIIESHFHQPWTAKPTLLECKKKNGHYILDKVPHISLRFFITRLGSNVVATRDFAFYYNN